LLHSVGGSIIAMYFSAIIVGVLTPYTFVDMTEPSQSIDNT